jgi:hypothetical protein
VGLPFFGLEAIFVFAKIRKSVLCALVKLCVHYTTRLTIDCFGQANVPAEERQMPGCRITKIES